jgi:hypothetical protein
MKKFFLLTAALGAAALFTPAGVFAADASADKPAAKADANLAGLGPKARIFAKYDANKNGVIDGEEIAAVRQAYAADPKGEFATYDKDHDGKLSNEEIAAIKPPGGKKGGGKTDNGKKKSETAKP